MSKITTAIIMAAGYGTRRLPVTKAVEKTMLPVGNRPVIDYVVECAAWAGITRVIFVVGEQSEQLRTYYGHNQALEAYLEQQGKTEQLEQIRNTGFGMQFEYVVQPAHGQYGTAVPLYMARGLLKDEPGFLVLSGDDFTWKQEWKEPIGGQAVQNDFSRLINTWDGTASHAMLTATVADDEVPNFGILETDNGHLIRILEKPDPAETKSRLINISKFAFSASILDYLERYMHMERAQSEYFLIDVVQLAIQAGEPVKVLEAEGKYLDGGSIDGWLAANNYIVSRS